LSSAKNTDCCAVLLDSFQITFDGSLALVVLLISISILREGLLLGVSPVPVETSQDFGFKFTSPDSGQSAHATGSLDVTNHTNNLHGWAFNNGASVDNVFLYDLLTFTTLEVFDNVSHTSFVAHKCSEMYWLGGIILGEMSDTTVVMSCAAFGEISK